MLLDRDEFEITYDAEYSSSRSEPLPLRVKYPAVYAATKEAPPKISG
jgi:hypothetical protein